METAAYDVKYIVSRRGLGTGAVASVIAIPLITASCTQTDWANLQAQFASVITQVQKGVRTACASIGVLVPTADTVMEVLIQILGTATVQGVTATVIKEAVDYIASLCPAATPTVGLSTKGTLRGKEVPVFFY